MVSFRFFSGSKIWSFYLKLESSVQMMHNFLTSTNIWLDEQVKEKAKEKMFFLLQDIVTCIPYSRRFLSKWWAFTESFSMWHDLCPALPQTYFLCYCQNEKGNVHRLHLRVIFFFKLRFQEKKKPKCEMGLQQTLRLSDYNLWSNTIYGLTMR